MKKITFAFVFGLVLISGFLLGVLIGRYQLPYCREDITQFNCDESLQKGASESALVPDAQLLELHIFREELMLDVPIPALRFQIKFRTPQKVADKMRVELHFKAALKKVLGDSSDATTCEMVEEHFGWTVYTYGYTIGGDSLSPSLLDIVVRNPYEYVSVCIVK